MELRHIATRQGRLSTFLKNEMAMSTGLMNRLKWQEKIFVNGMPRHNDYTVRIGDVITAMLDEETPQYPAEEGPLTVLYEDEHLLAVDKPAGMLIHPSRATMTGTLANRVICHFQVTGQSCAFHPVTRLDRDTFGVVLLAKNSHIHSLLQQTKLEKTYHAMVCGQPAEDRGEICAPIARKPLPSLLREVRPDGKISVTVYRVLCRGEKLCKLALQPVTGRTHQLRVHCAYMGWPILGDPQYCTQASKALSDSRKLYTQQLCAKALQFTHPITGQQLHLLSQLDVKE